MQLYFITGNNGKFVEAKNYLTPFKIIQKNVDLTEIQSLDSKEVIEYKLKEASKLIKGKFFVDDVSLYLDALNGFPGPLIKVFLEAIDRKGIYNLCKEKNNFNANAKATIGYFDGKEMWYFEGEVKGKIVLMRGESGFGWDPIFQPEGYNKTFAEMTVEEKNKISHRGKAIKKFKRFLEEQNKKK
jgi:XTP/dITP diphosphohydrolase